MALYHSYIICRMDQLTHDQELIISTEYPMASYDILNTHDTLVCRFSSFSRDQACKMALEWLKQQTVKNCNRLS